MKKRLNYYNIFMTAMFVVIAGLLLASGIVAVQKSMKLNLSFQANPNFQIEVRILKEGETGEGDLIFKNFGETTIHSEITSLNGITLNASDNFISKFGSDFTLIVKNYTKDIILQVGVTSTAETITGAEGVPAEVTTIKSEAAGFVENTDADYASFKISVGAVFEQNTTIQIDINEKVIPIWSGNVAENYAGGTGAMDDPYLISNGEGLALLAANVNDEENPTTYAGKYFLVTDDIYLNKGYLNYETWEETPPKNTWTPIGGGVNGTSCSFQGSFDGNNKTIYGLYFNNAAVSYVGLFGYCNGNSTFQNINISNSFINGENYVGGVIGECESSRAAGENMIKVVYCKNNSLIKGVNCVGGICGSLDLLDAFNEEGKIDILYCCNNGSVLGKNYVAGIIGNAYRSTDIYSINLDYCFNSGSINGDNYVSGIMSDGGALPVYLSNVYNAGKITMTGDYGAGICSGEAIGCEKVYNLGELTGNNAWGIAASGTTWSGNTGLYYLDDCGASAGFDGDTVDRSRTATELKTQSTYEGWDFDTVWAIDPNGVINDGFPYLRALPPTN